MTPEEQAAELYNTLPEGDGNESRRVIAAAIQEERRAAALDEREACAKLLEEYANEHGGDSPSRRQLALWIHAAAELIRGRDEDEKPK